MSGFSAICSIGMSPVFLIFWSLPFSTRQSATAAAITAASAGSAVATASRICCAVSTAITSTPCGAGTDAGPVTKLTRAPRSRSAAAIAAPCAPLERLAI